VSFTIKVFRFKLDNRSPHLDAAVTTIVPQPDADVQTVLEDVVGYLNFSSGKSEPKFLSHLSTLFHFLSMEFVAQGESTTQGGDLAQEESETRQESLPSPREEAGSWELGDPPAVDRLRSTNPSVVTLLCQWLRATIDRLEEAGGPFADVRQARKIVELLQQKLLPAYAEFHCELLYHQCEAFLWSPFFIGRAFEGLLAQGAPWDESQRIVEGAIASLNDYVGYRPVAILESGQGAQPYAHEFVQPIPLYIRGAGVATGPYQPMLARALEILHSTDPDVLANAWFDLERVEEIALDPRAYDFDHPAGRRPNYHFGQWDPHRISKSGYYTRFVLQQITLDALLSRCQPGCSNFSPAECLEESATVLAGIMLMASGTSGNAPSCHDSSVTLSTLLPLIAAYRDAFYQQRLSQIQGAHGRRLRLEANRSRQPFGGARQHLNHELARRRAMQLQRVHLAHMYARMGYPEVAIAQVNSVRVAAARMICKIYCHLTSGHHAIDRDRFEEVTDHLIKIEELIHRAIECGALVDPWNVVGFAGNFSLFPALENTVHDWRADELIELFEQVLDLAARAWSEAAAIDDTNLERQFSEILNRMAAWWDQFATYSVEDVKPLVAKEIEVSANLVAGALNAWHKAGAAAGDIAFWRMFVDQFDSSKSFQMVIEALLDHGDTVAARALMMQWVNQKDRTPLEEGDSSFRPLAFRWLAEVEAQELKLGEDRWEEVARFFAYLEANAEEYWLAPTFLLEVPGLSDVGGKPPDSPDGLGWDASGRRSPGDLGVGDEGLLPGDIDDIPGREGLSDVAFDPNDYAYEDDLGEGQDEEEEGLFGAAYEQMVFRDSTDDGVDGEILDEGAAYDPQHSEWEYEAQRLEQRLDFLTTVARLWKHAAITWGTVNTNASGRTHPDRPGSDRQAPMDAVKAERRTVFDGWLQRASANYRELIKLLETLHRHHFTQPSGSHESLVEFDRLRTLKEILIQQIITTCVETCDAARLILASCRVKREEITSLFGESMDAVSVQVLQGVLAGDTKLARLHWDEFLTSLRRRPLLYVPHSRGGLPRKIVVARGLQQLLHDMLGWLPQLGMIRETCQLLDVAQKMESDHPVGRGAVTEFDRLFENGYQAIVRSMVTSAEGWGTPDSRAETPVRVDHMLTDALQQLTEQQLDRWLNHSHTLRLSVVEKLAGKDKWQQFVEFVKRYGEDLFSQKFLSLGNLRGILHQGVGVWLDNLSRNPDMVENICLLQDFNARLPRKEAIELLTIAIESVVENYRVYRDYNTTTTQSDHGELLYTLIDFLRVRAAYDRVAWNLKSVVWAHEILVRQGRSAAAELWCRAMVERTTEAADLHLQSLQTLSDQYGMQLVTVFDRLNQRFVRPLVIDRVRALVLPAMRVDFMLAGKGGPEKMSPPDSRSGSRPQTESPEDAFAALTEEINSLASEPSGAGLDLPDWLAALEEEVTLSRSRMHHQSSVVRLTRRIGQVRLSWDQLLSQLDDLP